MTIDRIKARIQQLMRVAADDAATPAERENAMRHAAKMMQRYNLDRADVETATEDDYDQVSVSALYSRMTPWEETLSSVVADDIVRTVVALSGRGTNGRCISFAGLKADGEIAAATFTVIRERLVTRCKERYSSPVREQGRAYAIGYVQGVYAVAQATRREQDATADGKAALIRTDSLARAANDWLNRHLGYEPRESNASVGNVDRRAYLAGLEDGRRDDASVRRPLTGRLSA